MAYIATYVVTDSVTDMATYVTTDVTTCVTPRTFYPVFASPCSKCGLSHSPQLSVRGRPFFPLFISPGGQVATTAVTLLESPNANRDWDPDSDTPGFDDDAFC